MILIDLIVKVVKKLFRSKKHGMEQTEKTGSETETRPGGKDGEINA